MNQIELNKIVTEAEITVANAAAKLTTADAAYVVAKDAWGEVEDACDNASDGVAEANKALAKAAAKLNRAKTLATNPVTIGITIEDAKLIFGAMGCLTHNCQYDHESAALCARILDHYPCLEGHWNHLRKCHD